MKKLLLLFVCFLLFIGCGKKDDDVSDAVEESIAETSTSEAISTPEPTVEQPVDENNTIYRGTLTGDAVDSMGEEAETSLSAEELEAINASFRDYYNSTDGQVFMGHFEDVMDSIPVLMGYTEYEVLDTIEPTDSYPFRILVICFNDLDTYVVTESYNDGMVFELVTDRDTDYMNYAFKAQ